MTKHSRVRWLGLSMLIFVSALNLVNAATHLQYRDTLFWIGFPVLMVLTFWLLLTLRTAR